MRQFVGIEHVDTGDKPLPVVLFREIHRRYVTAAQRFVTIAGHGPTIPQRKAEL